MGKQRNNSCLCRICNTKVTQLNSGFGCWPTKEFKLMSDEAKVKFMQELADKHGKNAVVAHAVDTLKSYERTVERYAFDGEFRPLEFWKIKGYDTERIVQNALPHEKMHCRMAGDTYRVPV